MKKSKLYRVIRVYNIWTEQEEEVNKIVDRLSLNNMVANGYEIVEMEEV